MATNYTQRKAALDEIATAITEQINNLERARQSINAAEVAVDALDDTYGAIIAEINDAAAAAPTDGALVAQKNEAAKLVGDFVVLLGRARQFKTAVANL